MHQARGLPNIRDLVAPLIGLPYEHFRMPDFPQEANACWGLVRTLFKEGLQLDLSPDTGQAALDVVEIWGRGDARDPLPLVQPWDAYILATKHPWSDHLGLVVDEVSFVNVRQRTGVCVEPLRRWRPKLFQVARLRILL